MGKRKRKTKSTQTPPNMAAPMIITNQDMNSSPNLSQVLASANDSIYDNRNHLQTVSNNQFHHSTPMNIQQGPPMFNMTHVLPGPSVSEALPINTQQFSTLTSQQRPQPFCDNNTLQMILENMNHMNSKLAKLDMLDDLCSRMASIESHFNIVKTEIKDIRYDLKQQSERITTEEFHYNIVESRVSGIEAENEKLQYENFELKEKVLEMQAHSMKYNLIFSGIKERSERQNEKVEDTIKEFISNELKIDSEAIQFQNVHRLKNRGDGKPRNIIAKFVKYSDHEMIRSAAYEHLKNKKRGGSLSTIPS
ncbi:Hypothetical predicted protein [Mytilus galloprovincialis]|uniref:Uncharacterized protein n=1 Tax=Mytilus galloprovincialis TaxID=29158 RepID=A0A8B6E7L7_MYTGA|nr:Hypothetical predicted protein [Mytilus galloprovincialis]